MERKGSPLPAPVFSAPFPFRRPFPFKGKVRMGMGLKLMGGKQL